MSSPNPQLLAGDPSWFPSRLGPKSGRVRFLRIEREAHRAVTFLADEYLGPMELDSAEADLTSLTALANVEAPLHFIFHSAFAASTLLARALDVPGHSLGLKEPEILNDVANALRTRALDQRGFETVLRLLARSYAPSEINIVKPSNVANVMAPALLGTDTRSRAIFLYAPLPRFLRSVADKGLFGRRWARRLFAQLTGDTGLHFGLSDGERFELTDLQAAGLGWLMHHGQAASLIGQFPDRVRWLDSETFLARRAATIEAVSNFFELRIDAEQARAIADGEAFSTHSKELGRAFDSEEPLQAKAPVPVLDEEIGMVAQWIEAVAANAGLPMELQPENRLLR